MTSALKPLAIAVLNALTVSALVLCSVHTSAQTIDPETGAEAPQTIPTVTVPNVLHEDLNTVSEDNFNKSECSTTPFDIERYKMGMVLRTKSGEYVNEIIQSERAKGRNPKVLILARAGQDLDDAMVLKDEVDGRQITLQDMFRDLLIKNPKPGSFGTDSGDANRHSPNMQMDIKSFYKDLTRKLKFSHLGLLIINDPFINTKKVFTKKQLAIEAERKKLDPKYVTQQNNGGEFWVRELLKPCESLVPWAWKTGLSGFFQDKPHKYSAIVMIPDQKIQDIIFSFLVHQGVEKDQHYNRFLADKYNVAAPFYDKEEQNSNGFILEIFAAAQLIRDKGLKIEETQRADYLQYLATTGYKPTKIYADSIWLKGATTFLAPNSINIKTKDHPYAETYGVSEIVTELSIREYLLRREIVKPENIHELTITQADIKRVTVTEKNVTTPKK